MKLLKKISIATLIGKVPTEIKEVKNAAGVVEKVAVAIEQSLMRVIGLTNGMKTGNSNFGAWLSFSGQFEATNILTGEVARGANLFLPDVAGELLAPVVKAADGNDVVVGFDIGVRPAGNAVGYEYTVTPLTKPSENDALGALKASAFADVPALPAPKAAAPALAAPEASTEATAKAKK